MIPLSLYCPTCGAANATDSEVCFACKQPLSVAIGDNIPLLQGRYRILMQVGKGGFGAVYRAEDTQQHNGVVAIKQINLRGLTPQETIEATDAFNREVSLLTNLDHANLPHIHDNFTDPEHWYLVMDFIEGETLETFLEAKDAHYTMPLDDLLTIGIQLCVVLDYLHTREPAIIFRDLKPANIMRTRTNKLYLIDFGIARRFNPAKLKDTIPFGSPGYAAPEQYGKAQTTARADIYSLGALLHMLLTGDDPVDNPFHFSPLRLYGTAGLASLEKLIMRMVELKVEERPASVNEVKAELQRIQHLQGGGRLWQPPVGQTPDPFAFPGMSSGGGQQQLYLSGGKGQQQLYMPPAQRTRVARRKFLVGSLAVVGLTAIGAGAVSNIASLFNRSQSFTVPSVPPPQRVLFGNIYNYPNHNAAIQSVSFSPYNDYIASAGSDGTVQIWSIAQVMQLDVSAVKPYNVYKAGGQVNAVAWMSSLGKNMLAFSVGGSIFIWDLQKSIIAFQSTKEATSDAGIDIKSFAWSPDRKYIAFPTSLGLQIYDVNMKKVDRHLNITDSLLLPASIVSVAWSPDGKYLAAGTQDEKTFLWNASSGHFISGVLFNGGRSVAWSPNSQWLATVNNSAVFVTSLFDPHNNWTYFDNNHSDFTAIAWAPNGRYIALGTMNDKDNIIVWSPFGYYANSSSNNLAPPAVNANGSFSLSIDTHGEDIHSLAWSPDEKYIVVGADKAYVVEVKLPE